MPTCRDSSHAAVSPGGRSGGISSLDATVDLQMDWRPCRDASPVLPHASSVCGSGRNLTRAGAKRAPAHKYSLRLHMHGFVIPYHATTR